MTDVRQVLNQEAREKFRNLSPAEKSKWKLEFMRMDTDGSESVNQKELQSWFKERGVQLSVEQFLMLWNAVDVEKDGKLDFYEVGALILLLDSSCASCDKCGQMILDKWLYACPSCVLGALNGTISDAEREKIGETYCIDCFSKHGNSTHMHPVRKIENEWREKSFLDWSFCKQLQSPGQRAHSVTNSRAASCSRVEDGSATRGVAPAAPTPAACNSMYVCACCREAHVVMDGYLADAHLMTAPNGSLLCEWCTCWACNRCGKENLNMHTPIVGHWSKQSFVCADGCQGSGSWYYENQTLLNEAQLTTRDHCPTCRPRMLNGTMYRIPTVPTTHVCSTYAVHDAGAEKPPSAVADAAVKVFGQVAGKVVEHVAENGCPIM